MKVGDFLFFIIKITFSFLFTQYYRPNTSFMFRTINKKNITLYGIFMILCVCMMKKEFLFSSSFIHLTRTNCNHMHNFFSPLSLNFLPFPYFLRFSLSRRTFRYKNYAKKCYIRTRISNWMWILSLILW